MDIRAPRRILIPGPVRPPEAVTAEMGAPMLVPYGSDWAQIHREVVDALRPVFGTKGDVLILPSSGSGGLDAVVGALVTPGDRVAVVRNGYFGARLCDMVTDYGGVLIPIDATWGRAVTVTQVAETLDTAAPLKALIVVHHETSTGVLNPVPDIAATARARGVPLLVDAIASLGGIPVRMDEWGVQYCVTATQKCLEAPPGLAMVAVAPDGWEHLTGTPARARGWYLDLLRWRTYARDWAGWHPHPVTMPVHVFMALRKALQLLEAEGLEARIARYAALARQFRSRMSEIGMPPSPPEDEAATVVSVIKTPEGISSGEVVDYLDERGLRIAGGIGPEAKILFRVGHVGADATPEVLEEVAEHVADFLASRAASVARVTTG